MLLSLSGCGCYLDLSPGNNKGTLCSSVWHQRPTWMGTEGGEKELVRRKEGWERVKKDTLRNNEEKRREKRILPIWHKKNGEKKQGSSRVSTCWETADSLAVRDYCHVKMTVKMKETSSV